MIRFLGNAGDKLEKGGVFFLKAVNKNVW